MNLTNSVSWNLGHGHVAKLTAVANVEQPQHFAYWHEPIDLALYK